MGVFDIAVAQRTKARWWLLHLFANILVCIAAAPDCLRTLADPVNSTYSMHYSVAPTYIGAVIHAYHVMAFSNLSRDDIIHHFLFVPALCSISLLFRAGPLLGLVAFFMSGRFPIASDTVPDCTAGRGDVHAAVRIGTGAW